MPQRQWVPIPEYRPHFEQERYTDEELVEKFLDTTQAWYDDPANLLYGWRDRVRAELLRGLNDPDGDTDPPAGAAHQLVYAETKFSREWTGPEGMMAQLVEGLVIVQCQKCGIWRNATKPVCECVHAESDA